MLSSIRAVFRSAALLKGVPGCGISTTATLGRGEDRKEMLASLPKRDEGTVGEKVIAIDSLITKSVQPVVLTEMG